MTARERIKQFLTGRTGYVSTTIVHDHIESLGYKRCSSCGALSKMVARGEVLIEGYHIHTFAKLNPAYKATEASARQTANHSHLAKPMGRVPAKPKRENAIFDLCRQHSNIYALIDQPLREVRL
jgi:hypothetical protein